MEDFYPKEIKIFKYFAILACLGSANLCLNYFLKKFYV